VLWDGRLSRVVRAAGTRALVNHPALWNRSGYRDRPSGPNIATAQATGLEIKTRAGGTAQGSFPACATMVTLSVQC